MATCSDYINFNAVTSTSGHHDHCPDEILLKFAVVSAAAPLIIPSSANARKLCAMIIRSKF